LGEYANTYDSTRQVIYEVDLKLQDNEIQKIEEELKIIEYEVEYKIDVNERELKRLEYLLKRIEDKAFSAAEAIKNLGEQTGLVMSNHEINK
jgi:hypothetical protein